MGLWVTGADTRTPCWEERPRVCDEIRLTLAEVRRRTPLTGLRGTPGGRCSGPSSMGLRQALLLLLLLLLFLLLLPFFPPSPCDATRRSSGSNSSSQSPNTITWLTVPPLPPLRRRDIPGVTHTRHIPLGVPAPILHGLGGLGVLGGGAGPWPRSWGGVGEGAGASSSLLSKWRSFLGFLGALGGGLGALRGAILAPLLLLLLLCLLLLQLLFLRLPPLLPLRLLLLLVPPSPLLPHPHPTPALRLHPPPPRSSVPPSYPTCTTQSGPSLLNIRPTSVTPMSCIRPPPPIAPLHLHPVGVTTTRLHV